MTPAFATANTSVVCSQTDAETTIMKVQEKFRLDISREDAERTFLALIDSSVSALFPVLVENLHRVAAMMR